MTDPQHTERDEHEDPFARIDPFVALMDGRRQLAEAIASPSDEKKLNSIREKVENLCKVYPLYR